jgi:hypothetical protein
LSPGAAALEKAGRAIKERANQRAGCNTADC